MLLNPLGTDQAQEPTTPPDLSEGDDAISLEIRRRAARRSRSNSSESLPPPPSGWHISSSSSQDMLKEETSRVDDTPAPTGAPNTTAVFMSTVLTWGVISLFAIVRWIGPVFAARRWFMPDPRHAGWSFAPGGRDIEIPHWVSRLRWIHAVYFVVATVPLWTAERYGVVSWPTLLAASLTGVFLAAQGGGFWRGLIAVVLVVVACFAVGFIVGPSVVRWWRATPDTRLGIRPMHILSPEHVSGFVANYLQLKSYIRRPPPPPMTTMAPGSAAAVPVEDYNDDDADYHEASAMEMLEMTREEMGLADYDDTEDVRLRLQQQQQQQQQRAAVKPMVDPAGFPAHSVCGSISQFSRRKNTFERRQICWDSIYLLLARHYNPSHLMSELSANFRDGKNPNLAEMMNRIDTSVDRARRQSGQSSQGPHGAAAAKRPPFHCICSSHVGIAEPFVFMGYAGEPSLLLIDPEVVPFHANQHSYIAAHLMRGTYMWLNDSTTPPTQSETDARLWHHVHYNNSILQPMQLTARYLTPPDEKEMVAFYGDVYGPSIGAWRHVMSEIKSKSSIGVAAEKNATARAAYLPVDLFNYMMGRFELIGNTFQMDEPGEKDMLIAQRLTLDRTQIQNETRQRHDKEAGERTVLQDALRQVVLGARGGPSSAAAAASAGILPRLVEKQKLLTHTWSHCMMHCQGLHQGLRERRKEHVHGDTQPRAWATKEYASSSGAKKLSSRFTATTSAASAAATTADVAPYVTVDYGFGKMR